MTGSRPLSFRHNLAWTMSGNLVFAGCQWASLVVLAKLGSPEMVGRFALGQAVVLPVVQLLSLQLRAVQVADATHTYRFGEYLTLRLWTMAIALVAVAVLAAASGHGVEVGAIILAIGLARVIEGISDIYLGLYQQRERMDRLGRSLLLRGPSSLVALAVGVAWTGKLLPGLLAAAGAWAVCLLGHDIPAGRWVLGIRGRAPDRPGDTDDPRREIAYSRDGVRLLRLTRLALPLGITMMLIVLQTSIPRFFVEHHLGTAELGIYAALTHLLVAGSQVVNASGQAAAARLARHFAAGERAAFRRLLGRLVLFGLGLGMAGLLLAVVAGGPLLRFLYGPAYAAAANVLVIVMMAAGLTYVGSFLGFGVTATGGFDRFVLPYAAVTLVALVTAYVWIPRFGLPGAAWSAVAVGAAQCVISVGLLWGARWRKA